MPTGTPEESDVMFFAGFYEGEGSACGQANGAIIVQIPQKDPEVLYRGRSLWGGSIRVPSGRDVSVWVMSGDRARLFLRAVYPYLSSRRKLQIEKAGGLNLTGKKMAEVGGLSPERKSVRASLTPAQKHSESCMNWRKNNPEKDRAIYLRYAEKNREKINARQRDRRAKERALVAFQSKSLERNELVN